MQTASHSILARATYGCVLPRPMLHPARNLPSPLPGRKNELQTRILAHLGELDPASQAAAAALGRSAPQAPRSQWRMEQAGECVRLLTLARLARSSGTGLLDCCVTVVCH